MDTQFILLLLLLLLRRGVTLDDDDDDDDDDDGRERAVVVVNGWMDGWMDTQTLVMEKRARAVVWLAWYFTKYRRLMTSSSLLVRNYRAFLVYFRWERESASGCPLSYRFV